MINTNYNSEFSSRLNEFKKVLRKAVGDDKTYSEFYELVNIDPVYMSNLLSGRNTNFPNPTILKRISECSADKSITFDVLMRVCGFAKQQFVRPGDLNIQRLDVLNIDLGETMGSIQGKTRPCVVIQNNVGNKYSPTIIVAPITSTLKKIKQPTHVLLGHECGLDEISVCLFEQVQTVNKFQVKSRIGRITDRNDIAKIDEALKRSLGAWGFTDEVIKNMEYSQDIEVSMFRKLFNVLLNKWSRRELVFNN